MRCDGEPVRPGIGTTRLMSRVFEPAKQIGTRSAYTIRASGLKTPRQQAGHKTVPDMAAISSKCPQSGSHPHMVAVAMAQSRAGPDIPLIRARHQCPCKAGAIHTRCDGEPVRPGIGTTRLMSRVFEPAKQIGTRSAYTIRASGLKTPRQQAGHKTVPDLAAISSKCPCKAGAIHTGHFNKRIASFSKGLAHVRCHCGAEFPNDA